MIIFFLLLVIPNPLQKGLYRTEAETAYGRLPLMKVAYGLISHHPLLGVGLNNYVPMAKQYDFTPEQLAWRDEVRAFIREHLTPALLDELPCSPNSRAAWSLSLKTYDVV